MGWWWCWVWGVGGGAQRCKGVHGSAPGQRSKLQGCGCARGQARRTLNGSCACTGAGGGQRAAACRSCPLGAVRPCRIVARQATIAAPYRCISVSSSSSSSSSSMSSRSCSTLATGCCRRWWCRCADVGSESTPERAGAQLVRRGPSCGSCCSGCLPAPTWRQAGRRRGPRARDWDASAAATRAGGAAQPVRAGPRQQHGGVVV